MRSNWPKLATGTSALSCKCSLISTVIPFRIYLSSLQLVSAGFVLFVLGLIQPIKVMSSLSVKLLTLFLGRIIVPKQLTSTKCTYFASNWQMTFLNQCKGENDHRKYFMSNLHESYVTRLRSEFVNPGSWPRRTANCVPCTSLHNRVLSVFSGHFLITRPILVLLNFIIGSMMILTGQS